MSTEITTPAWVKDAIFYQIFPDRFAKSDRLQKPTNLQPWGTPPHQEKYMGGDLYGVIEQLDYLHDLGVTALYLNPIFQSASNHRYHTHDYYQVDPLLGGNGALQELVAKAHGRGMKVVLDGVFNHCSRGFFQFNDILEHGPHSAWLDWFTILDWPLAPYDGSKPANYVGWWDMRELPKFNTNNPQVWEFLMQVGEFWVREYDIDGWRLDVPEEITTPGFWEEFRERIKGINPEAYIVAEIWHKVPERLDGTAYDAVMNYPFASAILGFAAGDAGSEVLTSNRENYEPAPLRDAATFGAEIADLLATYDWNVTRVLLNLLDSHDTPRALSVVREDKRAIELATLFQMTYPGAPCIYYGNEIGLRGTDQYDEPHDDKDARWAFPYADMNGADHALRDYFKQAIGLRKAWPVLRHGEFEQVYANGRLFGFTREDGESKLLVLLNADLEGATAVLPRRLLRNSAPELLFGSPLPANLAAEEIAFRLPARSGAVWQL